MMQTVKVASSIVKNTAKSGRVNKFTGVKLQRALYNQSLMAP